ncbi:MAG: DUF4340 domain-containing protein [Burkholderiales bacterium]
MSRAAHLNIVLALLVAGLALFLYLRPKPGAVPELALSTLEPDQVTRVQVERGGGSIVLEKHDGRWYLSEPYRARADEFRTRQLLELLNVKASRKLPATELARFDLDRPTARVVFDHQPISFGTVNEMSNEQYVAADDGVYLIPVRHAAALPLDAKDLTGRQLFAADEEPVELAVGPVTMSQQDGRWRLSPETAGLSQDDLNRWGDEWKGASSLLTQKAEGAAGTETITVKLKSGKTVRLVVLQREPELILLREDEGLQYHFSAAAGKRLLTVPSTSAK